MNQSTARLKASMRKGKFAKKQMMSTQQQAIMSNLRERGDISTASAFTTLLL
jgi:hypothetical protein